MSRLFSLAYLTYAPLPAPEAIRVAAERGAHPPCCAWRRL